METTAEYSCAYCGETNYTFVDLSAGMSQSYIEDCQICCQPNVLYVRVDRETGAVEIESNVES